jgi:hypothetical protein
MVMFLVKSIHLVLNFRFDVSVAYLRLIILLVVDDVPSTVRRSLTDFMNFKIKIAKSFDAHTCVHMNFKIKIAKSFDAHTCVHMDK